VIKKLFFELKCISGRLNSSGKVYNGDTQKSHYIYYNPRTKELEEKVRRNILVRRGKTFF